MVQISYKDISFYLSLYNRDFTKTSKYESLDTHPALGIPQQTHQ